MNRREFIRTSCLAIPIAGLGCGVLHRRKPNFIFILTDDQRYDAVGYQNPAVMTPNLDKMATKGMIFNRAFVTCSICSPSRAACLTGRYGSQNGVDHLNEEIHSDEKTFAHYLKDSGYQTGCVGKWHLQNTPEWCGFDFATFFKSNANWYNRKVSEQGKEKVVEQFIEDYNAQQAIDFIHMSKESPFVLFYNTQVPHMNSQFDWNPKDETLTLYDDMVFPPPASWKDDLSGKPPYLETSRSRQKALSYGYDKKENIHSHFKRYFASITDMDAALGQLFGELETLDLMSNTYIIFMGDNGWMIGEHGFTSKVLPYEPSIRVPMFITGPDMTAGETDQLVLNIDILPTLLDLADIPIPQNIHGCSLVPLLKNKKAVWRTHILYEVPDPALGSWPLWAVRSEKFKYIQTYNIDDHSELVFEELYDLENDPHEMENLVTRESHQSIRNELKKELYRLGKKISLGL